MSALFVDLFGKLRRAAKKPPRVIFDRLVSELRAEIDRFSIRARRNLPLQTVLMRLGDKDIDALWQRLAARPYPARIGKVDRTRYDALHPADAERIIAAAEVALAHRVDLLGSGPKDLGHKIDWHQDFKTGHRWPPRYFRDIEYNNLDLPSDVKIPWELSRMQWLVPVGQAYMLTDDDRYAAKIRDLLTDWMDNNPLGGSVNWACTMDVALRAIVWTWFFHVFHDAPSWRDDTFRTAFVRSLYLHGDFIERHIERSDINGNHYTADATGMVYVGLFFGAGDDPLRWASEGWRILTAETINQIHPDGVDFEASVPYHRLVAELFLLPAMYRQSVGLPVESAYAAVLEKMARFTAAYTGPQGFAPVWGDGDDARVLPFGGQDLNDHRYLADMIASVLAPSGQQSSTAKASPELYWAGLASPARGTAQSSVAFPDGGFYIMRSEQDHVLIDCGPVGLAGRGGHGHNDCLSFAATLAGIPLIVDCGAYLYTADFKERNRFRSTAYHNTPQIDGAEINRFIRPDYLWNMQYDAVPELLEWTTSETQDSFRGSHSGFATIAPELHPFRRIALDKATHALTISDLIDGTGEHLVSIPFHLHPDIAVTTAAAGRLELVAPSGTFTCTWQGEGFALDIDAARVSFSYGVVRPSHRLLFQRRGTLPAELSVMFQGSKSEPTET